MAWETLERPALQWVLAQPRKQTDWLTHDSDDYAAVVPELTQAQLNEALHRLCQAGLITGPGPAEGSGATTWMNMRVTADGLRALGEWPFDLEMTVASLLAEMLDGLAEEGDRSSASRIKRASGSVMRFGDELVRVELRQVGKELGL
jgi:hypothetical protein